MSRRPRVPGRRRGIALLLVLWILALLTLLMYAFLAEMRVEYALSAGHADGKKAEQLCWSGIELACARAVASTLPASALWEEWADDPERFFELPLGEGAVTVFRPTYSDDEAILWGLDDEASKINLNTAPREVLAKLPRVTDAIADAIIDWRDADSTPGQNGGAEDSHYGTLDPPYRCKNQPFESVEELLSVRGITFEILYGEDANLNGRLDPNEKDGMDSWPPDNGDDRLDPGLWPLATVWSLEPNTDAQGRARVNVNTSSSVQLQQAGLSPPEANSIVASRLARGPLPSLAHLLGPAGPPLLTKERFKVVVDRLTLFDLEVVPGLVNVNTAPKAVLMALPGITDAVAVKIIGHRTPPGNDLSNVGWLTDVLAPSEWAPFANLLTCRAYQFRIHAVGRVGTPYGSGTSRTEEPAERPGAFRRMTAVVDVADRTRPRLIYWKDSSRLGMPYDPADGPEQTR